MHCLTIFNYFQYTGSLEAKLEEKNLVLVQAMKNALGAYSKMEKPKWDKTVEKEQVQ